MIRSGIHAARPLRGRANSGLWNRIETRKALLICVANQRFTTLAPRGWNDRYFCRAPPASHGALPVLLSARACSDFPTDRPAPGLVVRLGFQPTPTGGARRALEPRFAPRDSVQLAGLRTDLLL